MKKNYVKTKCKYKRWISFFWSSSKYERNGSSAQLPEEGVTYFARDPLRSYFYEPQKNEIYFLKTRYILEDLGTTTLYQSQTKVHADKNTIQEFRMSILTHISLASHFLGHGQTVQTQIRRGVWSGSSLSAYRNFHKK